MLRFCFFLIILCSSFQLISQASTHNTITPEIKTRLDGIQYQFSAVLPPLVPLPGAPRAPFYEYFWEFGDGHFSTEPSPRHSYRTGSPKEVRLYVTNNYAQGKTKPGLMIFSPRFDPSAPIAPADFSGRLELINHQDPVPNDEMVIAVGYRNNFAQFLNGHILLLYNETESKYEQFKPTGQPRMSDGEVDLFSTSHGNQIQQLFTLFPQHFSDVQQSMQAYRSHKLWRFNNLDPNEYHYFFQSFMPQSEIMADTNSTVIMTAYFIPENRTNGVEKVSLEMVVRKSHDPNKMGVRPRLTSFRNIENKTFKYHVDFQNTGDGPASTVKIETEFPTGMDRSSLKVGNYSPECPMCSETTAGLSCLDTMFLGNNLVFTFRNIGLAGLNSQDIVQKKQSKGYIEYTLAPQEKIKKKTMKSRTAIFMDQNPPVITNEVKSKFKLGISLGVQTGYAYFPDKASDDYAFLGATLTPYKERGIYPILGFASGINTSQSGLEIEEEATLYENLMFQGQPVTTCLIDNNQPTPCYQSRTERNIEYEQNFFTFDLSAGVRIDPFPWLTLGGGGQYTFQILDRQETITEEKIPYIYNQGNNGIILTPDSQGPNNPFSTDINTTRNIPALFGEIGLGQVQQGFSLGTRYIYSLNDERGDYWMFFLQFRF